MARITSYGELSPRGGEERGYSFADKLGNLLSVKIIKKSIMKLGRKENLLDIGCGYDANLSKPYFKLFENVYLGDVSLNTIKMQSYENLSFLIGDVNETVRNITDNSIDCVLAINVLEHLEHPESILQLLNSKLRISNSILLIMVPSWYGKSILETLAFKYNLAPKLEIDDHKNYYSKRQLWTLIRSAGFLPSAIKLKYSKFGAVVVAKIER